jgi:predicted short-subunit dehydrogenase-like oxidoreductase (DUF2520 family)
VTRQTPIRGATPTVAVLGMGRAGSDVARLLAKHGVSTPVLWSRSASPVEIPGRPVVHGALPSLVADVVILAVPDRAIGKLAARVADKLPPSTVLLHLSGAAPAAVARVPGDPRDCGSMHPLQTLTGRGNTATPFPWVLEGDVRALVVARSLVEALGCPHLELPTESKIRYHAAATVASNLLLALVAMVERQAGSAGLPAGEVHGLFAPLMASTLSNASDLGCAGALTGPLVRGDGTTIEAHLSALADTPEDRALYVRLSLQLIDVALQAGLPRLQADSLRTQLENAGNCQGDESD